MTDNKNFIIAVVLSVAVLILWQVFYAGPKMREEQLRRELAQQAAQQTAQQQPGAIVAPTPAPGIAAPGTPPVASQPGSVTPQPGVGLAPAPSQTRSAAIAAVPRIPIDTPSLSGSISLKGGRIDDLVLRKFTVTPNPASANVTFLSPSGATQPFFAEFGWVPALNQQAVLPGPETVWQREGSGALTPNSPVTLTWDNGQGLIFRRTISVDENYMFSVSQEVVNNSSSAVTLHPYGQVSRLYTPQTAGFFVLHEGPIGFLGDRGLQELSYKSVIENYNPATQQATETYNASNGWLGFTDKYWAAVLVPEQGKPFQAAMYGTPAQQYYANFLEQAVTIEAGASKAVTSRLFAGAKETDLIDGYSDKLAITNFDLLIDWGWFYFITKPMFYLLDFFYNLVGNFGVSILIVTVLIKLVFFPLANKSYESMSKLKQLQPEMLKLRDRYKDDKARQQQALMELYKKEKVNPMAGCLPILIQIPVFFALYKVLFVTIEMRHAPFFGWIQDLSAPDPTSMFNLFGLIPWSPPEILMIGIWPLLMGVTMFVQMKLNPTPPDPIQAKIFTYMPILFTFMLAQFPAGLVIYWTWNNLLSIIQQWVIMERQGVKVELFENMGLKPRPAAGPEKKSENGRSRKPAE
jgi:YidC/Oxa1 family membrane protein insertase